MSKDVNQNNLHWNYWHYLLWLKSDPKGEFPEHWESMWWYKQGKTGKQTNGEKLHDDAGYRILWRTHYDMY